MPPVPAPSARNGANGRARFFIASDAELLGWGPAVITRAAGSPFLCIASQHERCPMLKSKRPKVKQSERIRRKLVQKVRGQAERIRQLEGAIYAAEFAVPPALPKKRVQEKRKKFDRMMAAVGN